MLHPAANCSGSLKLLQHDRNSKSRRQEQHSGSTGWCHQCLGLWPWEVEHQAEISVRRQEHFFSPYLVKKFLPYFCQWSFMMSSTLCLRVARMDSHARTAHSPSFSRMWSEPAKPQNKHISHLLSCESLCPTLSSLLHSTGSCTTSQMESISWSQSLLHC